MRRASSLPPVPRRQRGPAAAKELDDAATDRARSGGSSRADGRDVEEALEEVERRRQAGVIAEAVAHGVVAGERGQRVGEVRDDVRGVVARAVAGHVDPDEREARPA